MSPNVKNAVFAWAVGIVMLGQTARANPIPIPPPASMPLEEMWIDIRESPAGLHASFVGDFTFDHIPKDVARMAFPLPTDATGIRVFQDGTELTWKWSSEKYPTVLPEAPWLPMIEWNGPFPQEGAVFRGEYEHDLIRRPDEWVFFYAVGTGKYFPTYDKTTTAKFDISLPPAISPTGIWLDHTPVDPSHYEMVGSHLLITLDSYFGPFTKDLIVTLVPEPSSLTSVADGNWNVPGTWDHGVAVPTAYIDTVAEKYAVTVAADGAGLSLSIEDGGAVAVNTGSTLDIVKNAAVAHGTLDIEGAMNAASVAVGAGELKIGSTGILNVESGEFTMIDGSRLTCEVGPANGLVVATGGVLLSEGTTLSVHAVGKVGSAGDTSRTLMVAAGSSGITGAFTVEPDPNEHLGCGVFYQGATCGPRAVKVNLFQALEGDAEGDGDVDPADLARLATCWDPAGGHDNEWPEGDFDCDGDVDPSDLAIFAVNWSPAGYLPEGSTAVPEPGTLALLGTGTLWLLAFAWRKRRRR